MKEFLQSNHWHLVINPNSCSSKCLTYVESIKDTLIRDSITFESHIVGDCDLCQKSIGNLCQNGVRHFMVAGGDGTLNEVINAIYNSQIDTKEVYVIVFSFFTGNDWCRTHQYPKTALNVVKNISQGHFIKHDVGVVETLRQNSLVPKKYFINIAGFGFDAAVIHKTVKSKPRIFPDAVYLMTLLKVLFSHKAKEITISSPDFSVKSKMYTIACGICQYNGNGMRQVPMANPTDGLFDVVLINDVPPMRVIKNVKRLYSGTHIQNMPEISVYQTNELTISCAPYELGEVEGEVLETGNYKITMLPSSINMLSFK
ncbi:MAG: hypothetical protein MJZ76_00695 [Bacteroidales bacterium]|nr:hypothetical protein [Bacteroidales bacterium]